MDCSSPGSSAFGIFQARILEWVAISSFRGSSQLRDQMSPVLQADSLPVSNQGSQRQRFTFFFFFYVSGFWLPIGKQLRLIYFPFLRAFSSLHRIGYKNKNLSWILIDPSLVLRSSVGNKTSMHWAFSWLFFHSFQQCFAGLDKRWNSACMPLCHFLRDSSVSIK